MTPDERQMIADLFQTIRSMGGQEKDREAEAFIAQMMRQTPDSPYLLAQVALVRGMELQQAGERIAELEQQIASMQGPAPAQRGGGSFLGGAAAAGAGAAAIGGRASGSVYGNQQAAPAQPWGQSSAGYAGRSAAQQAPMPLAQQVPPAAQAQPPARSGGFLKGALAAAAGVAGGVMLANSLGGLFGGNNSAQASTGGDSNSSWGGSSDKADDTWKNDDGSNDQGDSSWGNDGGGDVEL